MIADGQLAPRLGDAIVLLLVPGGEYRLGSQHTDPKAPGYFDYAKRYPTSDPKDWSEAPMQTVQLDAYLLGKFEVTQDQWLRLGGSNHSQNRPRTADARELLRPIDYVSWEDVERMLARHGLVLPTEARWENACRAGTGAQWPGGSGPIGKDRRRPGCHDGDRRTAAASESLGFPRQARQRRCASWPSAAARNW